MPMYACTFIYMVPYPVYATDVNPLYAKTPKGVINLHALNDAVSARNKTFQP